MMKGENKMSQFLGVLGTVGEDGTIKIPLDMLETAGINQIQKWNYSLILLMVR